MSDSSKRNFTSPFTLRVMVMESKYENSNVPLCGRVTIKHSEIEELVGWLREQGPDDFGCTDIPLRGWWKASKNGVGQYISAVADAPEEVKSKEEKPSGMRGRMG